MSDNKDIQGVVEEPKEEQTLKRSKVEESTVPILFGSAASKTNFGDVPSWLSGPSTTSFGSSSTETFGGGATFGSLSGSSIFGEKATFGEKSTFGSSSKPKKDEDEDEDEEDSNGEEDGDSDGHAPAEFGSVNTAPSLPPIETIASGEEGEKQLIQLRVKLYKLTKKDEKSSWTEVGLGPLRVNVPIDDPMKKPRIVMRRQGVFKLLLNAIINADMNLEPIGDNFVRLTCDSFTDDGRGIASYLVKCSREDDRDALLEAIYSTRPMGQTTTTTTTTTKDDGDKKNLTASPSSTSPVKGTTQDTNVQTATSNSEKNS